MDQKRPGTEIRQIRGFYYLYEAKCIYDKERKRGRKVTGKYLGRITEADGLVVPRPKKAGSSVGKIESDKEYGVTALYNAMMPEYKGFCSKKNIEMFEGAGMKLIVPLIQSLFFETVGIR